MNLSDLPPARLHPLAVVITVLRALRSLAPVLLVVLVTGRIEDSPVLIIGGLALVASLVEGIGGWLRYHYWVTAGELRVERGFFVRQRVAIPAERVQTVDVTAGPLQRLFGLVKVEVKTASGTQVVMSAITEASAERLRSALARQPSPDAEALGAPEIARFELTSRELLLAASTSGRLGVILSGMGWLYSQVDEFVEERLFQLLSTLNLADSMSRAGPLVIAGIVIATLLIAFLASVIAEVARFGGFSVVRTGDQLVIRRGLFERREVSVALDRIQAIRIIEGLLRQPFGYAAIIVETAGHADERGQSTQLHPFLHRSRWQSLLRELAPEHDIAPALKRPPRRALGRFLLRPVLTATVAAAVVSVSVPYGWLSFGLALGAPLLGWLAFRDAAVGVSGQTMLLTRRTLRRTTAIVRRRRVQFSESSSSWLQRRRQLADLTIAVASGTGGKLFSVPELDAEVVDELVVWSGPSAPLTTHSNTSPLQIGS
ncbi:MAG TPA: PH domain-containing protein [Polyangiaceae bacterium]|nr:PH domain-containing protein [Polyangiaceae bacterium]